MEILTEWWNLFFIASIGFSAILTSLSMFGVGGDSSPNLDHDADVDVDADADADHDIPSHGLATIQAHNVPLRILHPIFTIFGVGQMPISLIISTFCLIFGVTGLVSNEIAKQIIPIPQLYFWLSLIIASVLGTSLTKITAKVFSHLFPKNLERLATAESFLGNLGTAVTEIDNEFGIVSTQDHTGIFHQLKCYTDEDKIGHDTKIQVIDYDEEKKVYLVRRQQPELEERFQALESTRREVPADQRR